MERTKKVGMGILRTIGWLLAESFKITLVVIGAMFGGSALSRQASIVTGEELGTNGQHGMRTQGIYRR